MKITLTGWIAAITITLAASLPAQAQLSAGRDYSVIEPAMNTESAAKIEVIEYFSYGCPHCADLHPFAAKWAAKLPSDVVLKRVPVGFGNPYYQNLAKLYYTLEALGELAKLDDAVFHAIHQKGLKLIDDKSILDWARLQGIDAKKFSDAYSSFGVVSKAKRADQMAQTAKIRGVPALVVDGRYLMLNDSIKSHADLLDNTSKIIDKTRSERNLKKK
jgi:thiol:disulfide interchange protein DsbA